MKKNTTIILLVLVMVLIAGGFIYKYMDSQRIIKNSTRVSATLVRSDGCYASDYVRTSDDDKYYETEVRQHLVVEYQLNGETVQRDMGYVEVGEDTTRSYSTRSEREARAIRNHKYEIGKVFDVYVCNDGQVYIAYMIDNSGSESLLIGVLTGVVLLCVAVFLVAKKKQEVW